MAPGRRICSTAAHRIRLSSSLVLCSVSHFEVLFRLAPVLLCVCLSLEQCVSFSSSVVVLSLVINCSMCASVCADEDTPNLTLYVNEVALPRLQLHGEATIQMQYNAAAIKVTFAQVQPCVSLTNVLFLGVCVSPLFVSASRCCSFDLCAFVLLSVAVVAIVGYMWVLFCD